MQFIVEKLSFHSRYSQFTGTFDYEEYVSLKGVEDPNEGFETIVFITQSNMHTGRSDHPS